MSHDVRFDDDLPRVLAELGAGSRPDYGDDILERTSRTRQRPAWTFPSRWVPAVIAAPGAGTVRWRPIVAVALVLLALVLAAIGIVAGSRRPAPFGPAHNGAIVYADSGDIFVGDPRTGASRPIVTGPANDLHPQFSPDGSMISFVQALLPGANVLVARADGTDPHVINAVPLLEPPGFTLWSPDSRTITLATTTGEMLAFDVAGTSPGRSINPPGLTVDIPWSFAPPDGRRILFRGTSKDGRQSIGLYTMSADGSGLRTLVEPSTAASRLVAEQTLRFATWSPDGAHIAVQEMSADGTMDMWLMDADGSHQRMIGHRPGDTRNGWASWSPEGSRIAYQREAGTPDAAGYNQYSYRVVRIADDSIVDTGPVLHHDSDDAWSPDGTQILLLFEQGQQHQVVLDPDGGPARDLPWAPNVSDYQVPVSGYWQRVP